MKWAIIVLIMMSLIGSMMWVMPSPRQRFQSKLRLEARKHGFQVSLGRLTLPRAQGETEAEELSRPLYRFSRTGLDRRERDQFVGWAVARLTAIGRDGLPEGWSWVRGEGTLPQARLQQLSDWLEVLPKEVDAVESDAIHLAFYWREPERAGALEELAQIANEAVAQKL
ncbi:MAG TPA: hypothetical protein VLA39_02350 [Marinobacterium sp.]|nr:hypothetical protein [Marinobacterium sp.]